jgi:hypothetical protein
MKKRITSYIILVLVAPPPPFAVLNDIATINNICPTGILHGIGARYSNFINVRS